MTRLLLRLLPLLLLACLAVPARAVDPDDLLPVDQAFALSARAAAPDRIAVEWKIADGYYLYRHRIAVEAVGGGGSVGAVSLPRGKAHTDEFFGKVETYRAQVTGTLANVAAPGGRISLRVKYQGCADLGVCYPPQTRTLEVAVPGAAPSAAGEDGAFAALGRALSGQGGGTPPVVPGAQAAPLPEAQAFAFEAIAGDGNTLLLRFTPARGYYLYRDRSSFRLEGAAGIATATPRWPKGVSHRDEHFGDVVVYFDQVDVPLPLRRTRADPAKATLVATFQGCQTDGICYPPMTRRVAVAVPAGTTSAPEPAEANVGAASAASASSSNSDEADVGATEVATGGATNGGIATSVAPANAAETSQGLAAEAAPTDRPDRGALGDDQRLATTLSGPQRWLALLGFFGAGLLLAFTPCVLPMIPILSGLIAADTSARGGRIGARRGFTLSLVYVLANAAVFTAAGVVAGLAGANLQILFQAPWAIALFALLFVALALSMFGLYELQLPAAWRAKLGALSDRQRGGSWPGVAGMGALSALIVGPCVAPPLAAAVLYIGQAQDPWFGGAALFALAMGMGAPLLAFGMAAGRGLPTSGPWMVAVQRVFGFVFLALAVWMASRLLPGPATLALYGVLAFAFAAWLMTRALQAEAGRRWALRAVAAMAALLGTAQLLGALAGGSDPLQPLAGAFGARDEVRELPFRRIKSLTDLRREVAAAQAAGQPLMLDFYADWCVACREMEKYTFPRPAVHAALDGFVLLKADVTANDADDQALMRELGIVGPPATLFYVAGAERRELRLFGFEAADAFAARAGRAR